MTRFRLGLPLICCLLLVSPLAPAQGRRAQVTAPPPAEPTPAPVQVTPAPVSRPPSLVVDDAGNPLPMLVEAVDVDVVVRGLLAQTTMTMTFRNPHGRVLEGELVFPLPEGSTVSGYGLDVGGQIVEGVVVEKHQARIAFEAEVRKGVDPGLVEWVRGNNFRTRVYPIPASGTRTVMVRYVSELAGGAGEAVYVLPLDFEQEVGRFDLDVAVVRSESKPKVTSGLANFEFEKAEDRWIASASRTRVRLADDLRVALPGVPAQVVAVEKDGDGFAFAVHDTPAMPSTGRPKEQAPRRVALWWDASLSREGKDREPEMALLAELVRRWDGVTVDVLPFRDRVDAATTFATAAGDSSVLLQHLRAVPYDGGTDLSALDFPRMVPADIVGTGPKAWDLHLLASDGLGNVGKAPRAMAESPLYTITSDSSADHALLRHFAAGSGGAHVDLTRTTVQDAASVFAGSPFSLIGIEADPAQVADMHPRGRRPVTGRVDVTGRLLAAQARIVLRYGYGNVEVLRVPVDVSRAGASETGLVPRFWAQSEVSELAVLPDRDDAALLALGRRYGIVTPGASLLVLETLEQYIEYDVEPPRSREEIHAAWHRRRSEVRQITEDTRKAKVEEVVAMWQARVEWWETDFSGWRAKDKQKITGAEEGQSLGSASDTRSMEAEESDDVMREAPAEAPRDSARRPGAAATGRGAGGGGIGGGGHGEAAGAIAAPEKKAEATGEPEMTAEVTIQAWDPKTPYMVNLKSAAPKGRAYQVYLDQRAGYGGSPAYYLDCGHFFYQQGDAALGRRILTSILELGLDDPSLLRVVAYRLEEAGDFDLAAQLLEDVLELRPEEPQSLRDLALLLSRRSEDAGRRQSDPERADADLSRAMHLLHEVVLGRWDRFDQIEVIALMELNRLLDLAGRLPKTSERRIVRPDLDQRLRRLLDVGIRITLAWDADLTDVDLWVIEPTGEKAYYSYPRTAIGGNVSRDFTQGYGPEEYCLRRAVPGTYLVQANYYGSRQQTLLGPATVKAVVYTDFGREGEKRQELTLRLDEVQQSVTVGEIVLGE